jgi:hypothetical protein
MLRFSLSSIVEMMVSCGGKARAVIVAVVHMLLGYRRRILGGSDGGDEEEEGHGLPAGLLWRLCEASFLLQYPLRGG